MWRVCLSAHVYHHMRHECVMFVGQDNLKEQRQRRSQFRYKDYDYWKKTKCHGRDIFAWLSPFFSPFGGAHLWITAQVSCNLFSFRFTYCNKVSHALRSFDFLRVRPGLVPPSEFTERPPGSPASDSTRHTHTHPPHPHAPHSHMHSGPLVSFASDQNSCLLLRNQ